MRIRELEYIDLESASRVLWKSFYHAEKNQVSMSGMERFRDLVEPVSLSMNSFDGTLRLFGAFEGDDLLGVGGLKDEKCIAMLYVLPEAARKGIGGALLSFMEELSHSEELFLNASDGAVSFYEKRGYEKIGERRVEDDLPHTPMKKIRNLPKNS